MSKRKLFDIRLVTLDNIVVTNASISNNTSLIVLDKDKYVYEISNTFHISGNKEHGRMRVILNSVIKTFEKDELQEIDITANFEISFFFIIKNLIELMDSDESADFDLTVALANISYSTSRGILFTRLQGTIFKSFILPILSNDQIIDMFRKKDKDEKK